MKLRARVLPASNMRWLLPPICGVKQPASTNAPEGFGYNLDPSVAVVSVDQFGGDNLDSRVCVQNSCFATNSHFVNSEYQMSPLDFDDDSIF